MRSKSLYFYLVIIIKMAYLFLENDHFMEVIKLDLKEHVG